MQPSLFLYWTVDCTWPNTKSSFCNFAGKGEERTLQMLERKQDQRIIQGDPTLRTVALTVLPQHSCTARASGCCETPSTQAHSRTMENAWRGQNVIWNKESKHFRPSVTGAESIMLYNLMTRHVMRGWSARQQYCTHFSKQEQWIWNLSTSESQKDTAGSRSSMSKAHVVWTTKDSQHKGCQTEGEKTQGLSTGLGLLPFSGCTPPPRRGSRLWPSALFPCMVVYGCVCDTIPGKRCEV